METGRPRVDPANRGEQVFVTERFHESVRRVCRSGRLGPRNEFRRGLQHDYGRGVDCPPRYGFHVSPIGRAVVRAVRSRVDFRARIRLRILRGLRAKRAGILEFHGDERDGGRPIAALEELHVHSELCRHASRGSW